MPKRVYYPKTTLQQRIHLFVVWESTGDVRKACAAVHVSRSTFYYWKECFDNGGYAALAEEHGQAAKPKHMIPAEIADKIIAIKRRYAHWGKWQIAREVSASHSCQRSISPNTVRRVLVDAGLWQQ